MSQTTFPPFLNAEWLSTQQRFWENCFKINPQQTTAPDIFSLWNSALDNMRKQMSGWIESPLQQASTDSQQFAKMVEQCQHYLQQFPNWQTHFQTNTQLWQTHQSAQQQALQLIQQIGNRTIHLLNQRLAELSAQQSLPPQALYTAWIEAGEEAYAEFVTTEEYAKATGELINSWLAWRHNGRIALDELLTSLHLPTYAKTQQLQVKLADLYAQQQQNQQVDYSAEIASLNAEISRLQSVIIELQTAKETAVAEMPVETVETVQATVENVEEVREEKIEEKVEIAMQAVEAEVPKKSPAKKTTRKTPSRSSSTFKSH